MIKINWEPIYTLRRLQWSSFVLVSFLPTSKSAFNQPIYICAIIFHFIVLWPKLISSLFFSPFCCWIIFVHLRTTKEIRMPKEELFQLSSVKRIHSQVMFTCHHQTRAKACRTHHLREHRKRISPHDSKKPRKETQQFNPIRNCYAGDTTSR